MARSKKKPQVQQDLFAADLDQLARENAGLHAESLRAATEESVDGLRVGSSQKIRVTQLKPSPYNAIFEKAKTPEYWAELRADIESTGAILAPLLATRDFELLGGHARLKIAIERFQAGDTRFEYVPVCLVLDHLDETEKERRVIQDNLLSLNISQDLRVLLHAKLYPEEYKYDHRGRPSHGNQGRTVNKIGAELGLSGSTIKRESGIFRAALKLAAEKGLTEPTEAEIQSARSELNAPRRKHESRNARTQKSKQPQSSAFIKELQRLIKQFLDDHPDHSTDSAALFDAFLGFAQKRKSTRRASQRHPGKQ